jgi:hypothetical protein
MFGLNSLVRLVAITALAAFLVAFGLARAFPKPETYRFPAPPRYAGVNRAVLDVTQNGSFLLDTETGVLSPFKTPAGLEVQFLSFSPWRDDRGEFELVGRVMNRSGTDLDKQFEGAGLVRFKLGDESWLREVPAEKAVTGRLCWLPGSASRVLFAAGDGRLYVQELSDDDGDTPARPVVWNPPVPGEGDMTLCDPVCPPVPALGGRLIVSLSHGLTDRGKFRMSPSRLWWLKLDEEGRAVTAAGPLSASVEDPGSVEVERLPELIATPDGSVALACLVRSGENGNWRLRLATITFDPVDGTPVVLPDSVRELAEGCGFTNPAFSADGRRLYQASPAKRFDEIVRCFSVVDALGECDPRGPVKPVAASASRLAR